METPPSTMEAPQEKEKKRSQWWLIVILVLLLVMMGCCIIGAVLCRSSARLPEFLPELLPDDLEIIYENLPDLDSEEDIQDFVEDLIEDQEDDFFGDEEDEEFGDDQEVDLTFQFSCIPPPGDACENHYGSPDQDCATIDEKFLNKCPESYEGNQAVGVCEVIINPEIRLEWVPYSIPPAINPIGECENVLNGVWSDTYIP
jgi:hypothetical protein